MKLLRFLTFAICVHFWLPGVTAQEASPVQQPSPAQQPVATAAAPQKQKTFAEQLPNTVGFLKVTYNDGPNLMAILGTCFFVYLEDKRLGDNMGFVYLVTNRHMAEPGIEKGLKYPVAQVILRMNLRSPQNGIESSEGAIPMGSTVRWFFPADESTDLAVMQINPDVIKYDYQTIPASLFATEKDVASSAVEPGDPVVFAGYFYQFPGQTRIEPIVRQGVLAMMPSEKINTTLQKPGQLYLADAHAFHGNSGSPLFVNLGGSRHGVLSLAERYLLIGVVSGYYPEGESFSVPAATVLTGEVHDNSGIATVVPAEELLQLLNSNELQADRDAKVAASKR
ncbi:MAG: trypsin-like peptidase domain-containing protein [Candidatus Acidiferrales bacterium]